MCIRDRCVCVCVCVCVCINQSYQCVHQKIVRLNHMNDTINRTYMNKIKESYRNTFLKALIMPGCS